MPVSFALLSSNVRLGDKTGDIVAIDPFAMTQLPLLHTQLNYGKGALKAEQGSLSARLHGCITSVGTLQLWLKALNSDHKWNLEFEVRKAKSSEEGQVHGGGVRKEELLDEQQKLKIAELISSAYTPGNFEKRNVAYEEVIPGIEEVIGVERRQWSASVLRVMWPSLRDSFNGRSLSLGHERRYWNLLGLSLMPGMGYPLDELRIKEFWRLWLSQNNRQMCDELVTQQMICLRRVAAGLNRGQQMQIATPLIEQLLGKKGKSLKLPGGKVGKGGQWNLYSEQLRVLGAFERIDQPYKVRLAEALVDHLLVKEGLPAEWWSLGRLTSRHLFCAPISSVLPAERCSVWLQKLLEAAEKLDKDKLSTLIVQMARKTGLPEIDLPVSLRGRCCDFIANHNPELNRYLTTVSAWSEQEKEQTFGEKLPSGLLLEVE